MFLSLTEASREERKKRNDIVKVFLRPSVPRFVPFFAGYGIDFLFLNST